MWTSIAKLIIQFRLYLIIMIGLVTVFMGYYASKVQMSYDFAKTVPADDPEQILLANFKAQFGEDGNIIAIGLKDSSVYELSKFNEFIKLTQRLKAISGINNVHGLPQVQVIKKDTALTRFTLSPLFPTEIKSQTELDSLMHVMRDQKFFMSQLVNTANGATRLVVAVRPEVMNSSKRVPMVNAIDSAGTAFTKATGIPLRYAGLPYIRTVVASQVKKEMSLFLYMSMLVT
jgi:uncharacterized protein